MEAGQSGAHLDGSPYRCIFPPPGLTFKPFPYKEHDFRTPPKFLTPLPDRVVVAGYSAALNCAVRGHPKVLCVHARACVRARMRV